MKKFLCVAATLLLSIAALAAPPNLRPVKKPKLVLTIVVDQFRYDYLTRFAGEYNSGFAQLLAKGAVFTDAHHEHFPTVTAVGHSTILTGATPSHSGIVGNEWYDHATKKMVTSVSDDNAILLGGTAGKRASSPARFLVSTIGDEMKMSGKGKPKVIGVSIKDRAAILPAGRMADGAYWFDDASGNFVSSSYYFKELPAWATAFNKSRTIDQFAGKSWTPIGNPSGKAFKTMPAQADAKYFALMEKTPYGNEILEMFAEKAIAEEKLGQNNWTDLISVSFSANDYVGHGVGPDAPEVHDISVRTDRIVGRLLQFVTTKLGAENVLVVFTGDHGVAPLPELMEQRKMPGGRIGAQSVTDAIRAALVETFGEGDWVVSKSAQMPYLNHELIHQKKLQLGAVQDVAAHAVRELPHIFRVYTGEQLKQGPFFEDRVGRRVGNSYNSQRGADLYIIAEPYWLLGSEKAGASHGAPFNYDSHVPVIFMGAGLKSGRYDGPIAVRDIAPTLAALLDIEQPSGAEGRVLEEMFFTK